LRVRAGAGSEPLRREFGPHHVRGIAIDRYRGHRLGHVDRRAGLQHTANRTASVMRAMAGFVGLPGAGRSIAVANDGAGERIGGRDARRPARADGCKNLHHQGNQDYGKKILQPAHHEPIHFGFNHPESPKSRSGSRNYVAASRSKPDEKRCILKHSGGTLRKYQASGALGLNPQPSVAECRSFRRMLEF